MIIAFASCNFFDKPTGNCIGIVIDISDSFQEVEQLSVNHIKKLFDIETDPNTSATCILNNISDIRLTETSFISVKGETVANANILERKSLRDTFYSQIEQHIIKTKKSITGTNGSFVCHAIAKTLHTIATCSNCDKKEVIIFSDFGENTPIFSVFNTVDTEKMLNSPELVFKLLDKEYPLPDLGSIELTFIHIPLTKEQDEEFYQISQFFKFYYESHNAKVSITASLINLNYEK